MFDYNKSSAHAFNLCFFLKPVTKIIYKNL